MTQFNPVKVGPTNSEGTGCVKLLMKDWMDEQLQIETDSSSAMVGSTNLLDVGHVHVQPVGEGWLVLRCDMERVIR